ncbi:hypothetical protein RQP46_004783 [Phenoliferia psychrophenolica]
MPPLPSDTAAHPHASVARPLATLLPFYALVDIFDASVDRAPSGQAGHSGILIGWDSNESIRPLGTIRPLHSAVHDTLLAAIQTKPLVSLLCSPRLVNIDAGWTRELFRAEDIPTLCLPTLERLELDTWTAGPSTPPRVPPVFGPLRLKVLRLFTAVPPYILYPLLVATSSTLEVCDVYVEGWLSPDKLYEALLPSTPNIIDLTCVSNPSSFELDVFDQPYTPAFDRLLPHFEKLTRLFISATEISSDFLRLLPPTLRHLTIRSFNPRSTFTFSERMVKCLRDLSLELFLETFTVRDVVEDWEEEDLQVMVDACRARGIEFVLVPDSDSGLGDSD